MNRSFALYFVFAGALFLSPGRAFASPVLQYHRIPQDIVVNGHEAVGVTVIQDGLAQTFNCPNPQPYMAANQSSSGWACYDVNSGNWLLNALPPASANVYTGPRFHYETPYDHYNYAYPDYDYYPEGFPGGPALSFGFGPRHGHEYDGHGYGYGGHRGHEHGRGYGYGGHDGGYHR